MRTTFARYLSPAVLVSLLAGLVEELVRLVKLFDQVRARYAEDAELARKMATDPIGAVPEGVDVADLAALTIAGNVLLNLDEMLMKR